jgi:hypothetical protein
MESGSGMGAIRNVLVPLGSLGAALKVSQLEQAGGPAEARGRAFLNRTQPRAPCAAMVELQRK